MTTQYGPKDVINLADEGRENGYSGLAETLERYSAAWEADRAALERARALLKKTEYVYDLTFEGYYCATCGQGRGYGHQKDCELATLLAAASGGAA